MTNEYRSETLHITAYYPQVSMYPRPYGLRVERRKGKVLISRNWVPTKTVRQQSAARRRLVRVDPECREFLRTLFPLAT